MLVERKRKTLKELRQERGWSREKVAAAVDVSLTTIANLETGKHEPRMGLARDLARLFGVGLDDIAWPESGPNNGIEYGGLK